MYPMNTVIRRLSAEDIDSFIELVHLFESVFEMKEWTMPSKTHLEELLQKSDFMVFAAISNNQVVGGLTAYVLEQYYSEKPLVYLYDLAVGERFQRKGIGRSLIAGLVAYCQEGKYDEVFVQAEKADDHAIDFYRKTRITSEEQVVHFSYSLKGK